MQQPIAARPPRASHPQERYIAALWRELEATGYALDADGVLAGAGINLDTPSRMAAVQTAELSNDQASTLISKLLRLRAVADAAERPALAAD